MKIFETTESTIGEDRRVVAILGARGVGRLWASDRIGPAQMRVMSFSHGFHEMFQGRRAPFSASLHKCPKGVLVKLCGLGLRGQWAVPYHELTIYKSNVLSLHCGGQFLKLTASEDVLETAQALMDAKSVYLGATMD